MKTALLPLLLLLSGCATVVSINHGEPYSGVKTDMGGIRDTFNTKRPWYLLPNWAAGIISTIDLSLSAAADTAVLPYTISRPSRPAAELHDGSKIEK